MSASAKTIVIVGAGFFGVSAANRLAKSGGNFNIKLITLSNYAYFLVSSVRISVTNDTKGTIIPLKELVHPDVDIVIDEVVTFDKEKVTLKSQVISFDSLIIATGAKWSDPIGYTHEFKDDIKGYFTSQHEKIEKAKDIVLIGGGYNNIELAGEFHDKYGEELKKGTKRITLIHSREYLLPDSQTYSIKFRRSITDFFTKETDIRLILNTKAFQNELDPTEVIAGDEKIKADLVIHGKGVFPSVPPHSFSNLTNESGFIKIKDTFQSYVSDKIFAIGDVADFDYKGLVKRSPWLDVLINNVTIVANGQKLSTLAKTERPTGNVTSLVSLGSKRGKGQICLPFFGTFALPEWLVVFYKSKNLMVPQAASVFSG